MYTKEITAKLKESLLEKGVHSFFSPSAAYRWMNCPGSEHKMMEDTTLGDSTNEYSFEGTILHNLAQILLLAYLDGKRIPDRVIHNLAGTKFKSGDIEVTINSDAIEKTVDYVEYCIHVYEENPGSKMIVEGHTSALGLPTGSIDTEIISPDYLHVIDFKSGFVDVSAEDNMQLIAYGISAYKNTYTEAENILLTIHQNGYPNTFSMPIKELLAWEKKFARAQVSRFFRPGEWCYKNYCPYMSTCGQFSDWVCDGMEQLVMDERKWVDLIPQAKAAAKFGEAVNTELYKCLVNGGDVEGYELGKRKKPLSWKESEDLKIQIESKVGEGEAVKPEALITPAQALTKLKLLKKEGKINQEVSLDDLTQDNGFTFTIKESKNGVEKKTANQLYFEDLASKLSKEKK